METVRFEEMSEDVRRFLDRAFDVGGVLVEDAAGRARGGVLPYFEADEATKRQTWQELGRLQQRVTESMQKQGLTEADIDRALQADD